MKFNLRKVFVANGALERLLASVPSSVEHQGGLVSEFGVASRAMVLLLFRVDVVVIKQVGTGLERGAADVANKGPVIRVDQSVSLKQLLVPESFATHVAFVGRIAVRHLLSKEMKHFFHKGKDK